jgi:predicted HAD superfamily hydrolase
MTKAAFSKSKILNIIKNKKVISFDIFDTLIVRPLLKPTDLFEYIERELYLDGFAEKRKATEKELRKNNPKREISYDDIYRNLNSRFKCAYKYELELEQKICQKNPEIHAIYKYCIKNSKTILFTSDTYLPETTIKNILKKTGYQKYDFLFTSSKYKERKSTGKLFEIILKRLDIKSDEILHIGDNIHSDVRKPLEIGIKGYHYPKVMDRFLEKHYNLKKLLDMNPDKRFTKDPLTISIILGINALLWIENKDEDYWIKFGSLYAAPLLYAFTNWIYETAKSKNIKDLAFIARDGFSLIKIFQLFDTKEEFNTHYVYLPRYISESSNFQKKKDLSFHFKSLGSSYENTLMLIKDFASSNNKIRTLFESFNKTRKNITLKTLQNFVLDNSKIFFEESRNRRNLIYDYLTSLNFLERDLAMIDSISVHARTQKVLQTVFNENLSNKNLYGLYFTTINQKNKQLNQHSMTKSQDRKYVTDRWNLVEFLMSAPEKPVWSIKKKNEKYQPVYQDIADNHYEKERIKTYKEVAKGIDKFSTKIYEIFGRDALKNVDTLIIYINNLINKPSTEDIAHLKAIQHSVNHDSDYQPLVGMNNHKKSTYTNILNKKVPIERISPHMEHFFTGYFDIQSTNDRGDTHLALNVPFIDRIPTRTDPADVCLIKDNGIREKIGRTYSWNFQQGSFLQYRPNHKNQILYNIFEKTTKKYKSILYNIKTKKRTLFPLPVANISQDGNKALCLNFSRLYDYRKGYGYCNIADPHYNNIKPKEDGVFLMDLNTGNYKLIISYETLWKRFAKDTKVEKNKILVNHINFNPNGTKFVMLLRWFSETPPWPTLTVVSDKDGNNIKKVFGFGSHYNWKDNETLIISGYDSMYKENMGPVTAYELNIKNGQYEAIDPKFFVGDGHCSYSPNKKYVLYDSYSSKNFRYRKLQIYDLEKKIGTTLGYFYSDPDFYKNDSDCRCDLHPRWSVDGSFITFDSIHEGYRGIYKILTADAIKAIHQNYEYMISEEEIKLIERGRQYENIKITNERYKNEIEKIKHNKWYRFGKYSLRKKMLTMLKVILRKLRIYNLVRKFSNNYNKIKKKFRI